MAFKASAGGPLSLLSACSHASCFSPPLPTHPSLLAAHLSPPTPYSSLPRFSSPSSLPAQWPPPCAPRLLLLLRPALHVWWPCYLWWVWWQAKRLHLLLTMRESAGEIPGNLEARRRIEFFTNSLFMRMPSPPLVVDCVPFWYAEQLPWSGEKRSQSSPPGWPMLRQIAWVVQRRRGAPL